MQEAAHSADHLAQGSRKWCSSGSTPCTTFSKQTSRGTGLFTSFCWAAPKITAMACCQLLQANVKPVFCSEDLVYSSQADEIYHTGSYPASFDCNVIQSKTYLLGSPKSTRISAENLLHSMCVQVSHSTLIDDKDVSDLPQCCWLIWCIDLIHFGHVCTQAFELIYSYTKAIV